MSNNNQKSNGGGCFSFILFVVVLGFVIKGCSGGNVSNDDDSNALKKTIEKTLDSKKDTSEENQKKFLESGNKFYDMYMDYFGKNYSIDDEPFEYGEYKGDNEEKYRDLAEILNDMCKYYNGIKKQGDRYDVLGELPFSMYDYIYNVRQMLTLIDGVKEYDDEKFTIEYGDYIAD